MKKKLKILILEDVDEDITLLKYELKRAKINFDLKSVETKEDYTEKLDSFSPDIILADYSLPHFNGIEALRILKKSGKDIPFILVTGTQSEEVAVQCMKEGADDYILKSSLKRLPNSILNAINKKISEKEKGRVESELKKSEIHYRHLFNNNPHPMWIYNKDTLKFIAVNEAAESHYGYSRKEFLNMNIRDLLPRKEFSYMYNISLLSKDSTDISGEWKHLKREGTEIFVEIKSHPISYFNENAALALVNDITEKKKAEEALRESQERYQSLVNLSPDAIYILDNGKIKFINPAGVALFGAKDQNQLIGKEVKNFIHPSDHKLEENRIEKLILGKAVPNVEQKYITLNGNEIEVEVIATPFNYPDEPAVLVIARDISKRKQSERKLRSSLKQLRMLSDHLQTVREEERIQIAREIHDELGQLLTGLKMDIVMLDRKLPEDKPELRYKINSMLKLVDSILQSIRRISTELRPGVLDALGLIDAIEWQAKEFSVRTGIICNIALPENKIKLDQKVSSAAFRIFQETLTNVARHARASHIDINIIEEKNLITLQIKDNGKGIKDSEISNTKTLGILGMKERVNIFGGNIEIKGEENIGTTVTVKINLSEN